jgi:hypothetical protein
MGGPLTSPIPLTDCFSESPSHQRNFTMGYIENLKLATAEANRQRKEEARAKRPPADPRIVSAIPLKQQVQEYLLSQPPIMRDKPISLMSLRAQLQGRYNSRPSAGDLGIVLASLQYRRVRDYSNSGNGRRFWLPPSGSNR